MFFIYLTLQVEFIRTAYQFRLASVVYADVLRHELVGCLISGLHCDASIPKCELPERSFKTSARCATWLSANDCHRQERSVLIARFGAIKVLR
jgi:hypothetical protein